ncbi:MAG: hypothetical protein ACOC0P_06545, partial [Planctomycetota bacterium]
MNAQEYQFDDPSSRRHPSVHVRSLEIHRVPKRVDHGSGFGLRDLEPGVVLIHGPNGSGKSTSALVLQELLQPGATSLERVSAVGKVSTADGQWEIELDAGYRLTRRNGVSDDAPDFGPVDDAERYRLALDELLRHDDQQFARQIALESQGGFDLKKAGKTLRFDASPGQPRKLKRDLDDALQAWRDAEETQKQIQYDADRLQKIEADLDATVHRISERENYELAKRLHEQQQTCRELEAQLSQYPEVLSRLNGDEREQLNKIHAQVDELNQRRGDCESRIRIAHERIDALTLPETPPTAEELRHLEALVEELEAAERQADQLRQQCIEAEAKAADARKILASSAYEADDLPHNVRQIEIGDINDFAQRMEKHLAAQEANAALQQWLQSALTDSSIDDANNDHPYDRRLAIQHDAELLRDGFNALARWLASPDPEATQQAIDTALANLNPGVSQGGPQSTDSGGRQRKLRPSLLLTVAIVVIAVLAIVLAMVSSVAWLLVMLIGIALVAADLFMQWQAAQGSRRPGDDETQPQSIRDDRATWRATYEQLNLPTPDQWAVDAVGTRLIQLARAHAARQLNEERDRRLKDLEPKSEALADSARALDEERSAIEAQLGLALRISDLWVSTLARNLADWQRDQREAHARRTMLVTAEARCNETRNTLNQQLQAFGERAVERASTARHDVHDLRDRINGHREAQRDIASAEREINEQIQPEIARAEQARTEIYRNLNIHPDEDHQIDSWLRDLNRYRNISQALSDATAIARSLKEQLQNQDDVIDLSIAELDQRISDCKAAAARREALLEERSSIRTNIENAKRGRDITHCLQRIDELKAKLANAREQNARDAVGAALLNWVQQTSVDRARPAVFRRANEYLLRFTHGRLQLDVTEDNNHGPVFTARGDGNRLQHLDELSVGERMQLLMAVRLAFIEQHE